jgi:putative flavoprotein involved in K+ transport
MATAESVDVAVVGGGQAGLAAAYHLAGAQKSFAVLEAGDRIGDSWRSRWESLELFTAARYSALPGLPFPGAQERFPGKDEVADYLEAYAREFAFPVRLGARVRALSTTAGGYDIETRAGVFQAESVIVATGAYPVPGVPDLAGKLAGEVSQLHSAEYREPGQLPDGDVLVVGGANSGAQIAEELAQTRRVYLARGGRIRRMPRRIIGKSLHWWGELLGLISAPIHTLRGRLMNRDDLLIGTSYRALERRHGVRLKPRAVDAQGSAVRFEDGSVIDVKAVVWATGFRSDYSWIDVSVFDERGLPVHHRGVTEAPGLYFLGLHLQYSRGSSLIGWVHEDAAFIVERIASARPDERPRAES